MPKRLTFVLKPDVEKQLRVIKEYDRRSMQGEIEQLINNRNHEIAVETRNKEVKRED